MTNTVAATTKVYSASGSLLCEFPGFTNLTFMEQFNNVGSWMMQFPNNAVNATNLISDSQLQIAMCLDYGDGNGFTEVWRGIYEQDNYDSSMPESAVIQANGRSMVGILSAAVVYPSGGVGTTPAYTSFTGATPGQIMINLINAAQARGCFPGLSVSFTVGHDTSGNAWAQSYTYSYSAGTNLLNVLVGLAQGGLCDFSMSGTTLNIYNPGTTLATDRSTTVFLRRGREILTNPVARDRTQLNTAMLLAGDNGVTAEVTNSGQITALGRFEGYMAQSGVTDKPTLTYWGNQALGAVDDQLFSYVATLILNVPGGTPMPWRDYKPGDYLSLDVAGTPVKYRAEQWVVQTSAGGPATFQITFNDVFYDAETLLQGKLAALSGSVTGPSQIATLPGPNSTIPEAPAFTSSSVYTSAYYSPATGTTVAQIELAWTTPTNTDGTSITDGNQYVVQYQLSSTPLYPILWSQIVGKTWSQVVGNPWSNPLASPINTQWTSVNVPFGQNACTISGLLCGETYNFQIATNDVSGNQSPFSTSTAFLTATDNVAPATPDAPTVSASMVAVQVMSDLGTSTGGTYNLAQDLDHLEVHYSYEPNFTAVAGVGSPTYLGKLIANAGMMAAQIAAVGTFQVTSTSGIYIRVIAVDESGNASPASAASGVTAVLIDDSHISSLNVSKLIAGTISASIVLGSTIETATSGARVSMDGTHDALFTYDSNGTLIGAWAGASGTDPSTSVSYPAGWSIFNDPAPGYMQAVSNTSGTYDRISPVLYFSAQPSYSTTPASIKALAASSSFDFEIFEVTSAISAGDTDASYVQLIMSSAGTGLDAAHAALTFNGTTNGPLNRIFWDQHGVTATQGQYGTVTSSGNVVIGGGLDYCNLYTGVIAGTTNGSGQLAFTYGPTFGITPQFAIAVATSGTAQQIYISGITTTGATATVYNQSGALVTTASVNFWFILVG